MLDEEEEREREKVESAPLLPYYNISEVPFPRGVP